MAFNLDNYVEVKDRIQEFYEKWPDGAIRTDVVLHSDTLVVVKARAFRHRDDAEPMGEGHSQMQIPGRTQFTKDSELENAETSAVGRALAACGLQVHNSIASREEVQMRQEDAAPAERLPEDKANVGEKRATATEVAKILGTDIENARAFIQEATGKVAKDLLVGDLELAVYQAKMEMEDASVS